MPFANARDQGSQESTDYECLINQPLILMSDLLICRENASDYALQAPIRIMINQALTLLLRGGCGRLIAENHYLPVPYGRGFSISYFSPISITSTL